MMKYFALIVVLLASVFNLKSQDITTEEGKVSYVTSQNVYVKFNSTEHISVGDTLYISENGAMIPALKVTALSSISCVCTPLASNGLKVNDPVTAVKRTPLKKEVERQQVEKEETPEIPEVVTTQMAEQNGDETEKKLYKQELRGRLSVSSYSNFSNTPGDNIQRMRYSFSMNASHIGNSKFSFETYFSFVHSNKNWDDIRENMFNGLKIYNFAVRYQPVESVDIWLGRKINPSLSNVGAIDGLQAEKRFKSFFLGGFVGSRPDYTDYSFNFDLFQYGAYMGHVYKNKRNGDMRTTLAFIEQTNKGNTDRRYMYVQHYNSLLRNLYFFGSAEVELYQNINGEKQNVFNLTNLYLMLRYRVIRQLSFSLSYSSRQNLIYYESYKDFVERLIDDDALQGVRFQVNYRPIRKLSVGVKVNYRTRKDDPRPSKNLYTYVTYSQVPGIDVAVTVSATFLESAYLSGGIYSLGLSRDLVAGKLYTGLNYRYVDYRYSYIDSKLNQHVADLRITWKVVRRVSISAAYEGVFEDSFTFNRIYVNLTGRL